MFTGILKTDGGPHSSIDWAYATASMLALAFEVKPESPNYVTIEMAKDAFRAAVTRIMMVHHEAAQKAERQLLLDGKHERLDAAIDAAEHTEIEKAVADIHAAVLPLLALTTTTEVIPVNAGTLEHISFADQLDLVIRQRVAMDITSIMHEERSWHAKRNPENPYAIAFEANVPYAA